MPDKHQSVKPKTFRLFDIVLFNVCCILGMDTISAGASLGVQGIIWRILGIALFFLPYGLVSAELGSTWPRAGGIYVWIKKAFGEYWSTMASWLYWINIVYWMPSIFITFATIFLSVFFPGLHEDLRSFLHTAIGIILIWITVYLGIKNIKVTDVVTNIGAMTKAAIFLVLGLLGIWYAAKHKIATSFALSEWKITWSSTLAFAPLIVYNFMGFELVSSFSDKLRNPKKDIPRAVILAGILISFLYIFSAFGILSVFKTEEIHIVTGISDSLETLVAKTLGVPFTALFYVLILGFLLSLYAFMFSWAYGANCVISATGLDKKVKILGHRHPKHESPDYAFYTMGFVGTLLLLGNSVGLKSVQQIFWTIFALASVLFLLPYLLMFPAVLKLRKKEPETERPFRIPGGKIGLWITVILGEFFILLACIFFFVPPKATENVFRYELSLVLGILVTLGIGVLIHLRGKNTSFPS